MKLQFILLVFFHVATYGQHFSGAVFDAKTKLPIEFVNIGVGGKNIGTTSDEHGKYSIDIDSKFDQDSILFSRIGYEGIRIKVSDLKARSSKDVLLETKSYRLDEVVVYPKVYKQKTLGYTSRSKAIQAGFDKNDLGYECGVLLKIKKKAKLESLCLNVVACSFDTIFYRVNLYKQVNKSTFENILKHPIYLKIPQATIKDQIRLDLISYNLNVEGDCLLTLEHIKQLGTGNLLFSASFPGTSYYRKTSQGNWQTIPFGISFSVQAKIEK